MVPRQYSYIVVVPACVAGLCAHSASGEESVRLRHVRPIDGHVELLLTEGLRRSPSLRGMLDRLARSDVVVYVECSEMPPPLAGRLTFMSAAGGSRYLMVRLACEGRFGLQVGTLAHELQHAIEIAERSDVVDELSLARAYRDLGFRRPDGPSGSLAFDSRAANQAGRRVWLELALRTD
jgi:hypothetical protein